MTKTLEEQAIDNENRIALMATTLAAARVNLERTDDEESVEKLARWAVSVAKAIQKEAGK